MVSRNAVVRQRELTRLGAPTSAKLLCNRQSGSSSPVRIGKTSPARGEGDGSPAQYCRDSSGSGKTDSSARTLPRPPPTQRVRADRQTAALIEPAPGSWGALASQ